MFSAVFNYINLNAPDTFILHFLRYQSGCGARFVLPCWRKHTLGLVEAGQTMNTGLDQNQTEFAVGVLAIAFQMLSDGNGFLDQIVQILRDVRFQTDRFHDAQNFVAADKSHLCNTMRITQDDTFIENANIKQTHSKNITSNYYRFEMGSCPSCPIS